MWMRGLAVAFGLSACTALAAPVGTVVSAEYSEPTTRYSHGILGDAVEWGTLRMMVSACDDCTDQKVVTVRLPDTHVFEDTAPRIVDVNGDGVAEVMVVETQITSGARLAIYGGDGTLMGATPYIGRSNRWLAPLGAADMDGDGRVEVAYIDRPHLAKTLRVWRLEDGEMQLVAEASGLTNHRIGEDFISGGLRDCGDGVEAITANANWTRVIATRLNDGVLSSRDIGRFAGPASFDAALDCQLLSN